jgi:hypothetical protein
MLINNGSLEEPCKLQISFFSIGFGITSLDLVSRFRQHFMQLHSFVPLVLAQAQILLPFFFLRCGCSYHKN